MRELIALLKLHEGWSATPYKCTSGKSTIGFGRNLDDNPLTPEEIAYLGRSDLSAGITRAEGEYLLINDAAKVVREIDRRIPWAIALDPVRYAVLIDMGYNLGVGGLLAFSSTLAAIQHCEYNRAARMMLQSRWSKQVGARAVRLADMMRTGQWPKEVEA